MKNKTIKADSSHYAKAMEVAENYHPDISLIYATDHLYALEYFGKNLLPKEKEKIDKIRQEIIDLGISLRNP